MTATDHQAPVDLKAARRAQKSELLRAQRKGLAAAKVKPVPAGRLVKSGKGKPRTNAGK